MLIGVILKVRKVKNTHKYHENLFRNILNPLMTNTAQKVKFSIKDFFSKCDQTRSFLRSWSHLLKKSLMENFISCAAFTACRRVRQQQ